jgi:hypothetical protein
VVYAILSAQTDTQYVRLYSTYNPEGFDPYTSKVDKAITDASVTIRNEDTAIQYRDTTVERYNKARYRDDIRAYIVYSLNIKPGSRYDLEIDSRSFGKITANLLVPFPGRLTVTNAYVFRGLGQKEEDIYVVAWIRYATAGFMVRYYLDFDILEAGQWVSRRIEVPSGVVVVDNSKRIFSYPQLQRRKTGTENLLRESGEGVSLSRKAFELTVADLYTRYSTFAVRVRGLCFVLTQVEPNLCSYYMVSNSFQDPNTVRMDMPNWTNINGGVGVFGAVVEDSLRIDLGLE